ncbi:hypothetical protein TH63_05450 [Rufibacter radiotolerans]|uniref:DUF3570 domain-containing protein n=1 Tax=Rufibacter radiotolerans TaxID=1379910 RepID=A0A0H4W457_9BACT|nr:DUF3570 domain-containing protein [Rufibacter radiotolerans]AKQ45201.1 hypothetical protein TH63_05450 [Rufibacter radiotolerans]
MRKIYLHASLFFLSILSSFAQTTPPPPDSAAFRSRKLKTQEINFVTSYYTQDGNNSAVTGGIGTEELTDVATTFDITMTKGDFRNRLHSFRFELGFDHYSSASSDLIDPTTISSASAADNRIYPSLNWTMQDDAKNYAVGAGVSVSTEYDYFSKGVNFNFTKFSQDRNQEFGLALSAFLDNWSMIYPIELRTLETPSGPISNPDAGGTNPRNSYNGTFTFSQVINQRMQASFILDLAHQTGQLATPYQRVYFQDNSVHVEKLPDSRTKIPIGARFNFFATDRILLRSFYRFYIDDWGISAHTAELEVPYKLTPFLSISPFYRYYTQTAADYFAPYREHTAQNEFYTSDYDLSDFSSNLFGVNVRFNSANGIFHISKLNTLELRYGHYDRSTGLVSDAITLAATIK